MRWHLWLITGLVSFLAACSSFEYEGSKPIAINSDFFGICPSSGDPSDAEFEVVRQAGGVWVRQGFFWGDVEKGAGNWDWSYTEGYVTRAQAHQLKVLAVLDYDVEWIHGPRDPRPYISPAQRPLFLEYVRRVVSHFRGRVGAWEIWNEPNQRQFWVGTREEFIALHLATVQAIREADPDAVIIGGAFSLVPEDWVRSMFQAGAFARVDGLSCHPYGPSPEGALWLVDRLTALAREYGFRGPIWLTEMGYPTSGFYPSRTTLRGQADYIVKTFSAAALRGVRAFCWYILTDYYNPANGPPPPDSEQFFGLVNQDFSPKPGYFAFQALTSAMAEAVYDPSLIRYSGRLHPDLVALPFRKADGSRSVFLWSRHGEPITVSMAVGGPWTERSIYGAPDTQSSSPTPTFIIEGSPRLIQTPALGIFDLSVR